MKTQRLVLSWVIALLCCLNSYAQSGVEIYDLRCEYLVDPLGIDGAAPRLTWKIADNRPGARQTAYRVIVGVDSLAIARGEGQSWDTDEVASEANLVVYGGAPLKPFTRYYWMVESKGIQGVSYRPRKVAFFETGMMGTGHWQGAWIADGQDIHYRPAPYFRKQFDAAKRVKEARAYIAVAGLYELYINGMRVGTHRLDPIYTRFDRRILYVTHDVTELVQQGANAIGVVLGNGWYNHQAMAVWNFDKAPWRNRPAFCLDLRITYEDGTVETIASERDWRAGSGAITSNNIYTAEHYDARLEQAGWNNVGFDDSDWRHVSYRSAPSSHIVAQTMHPIRNVEEIKPKSLMRVNDSTYLFDLGRNIAGVSQLTVSGAAGTVLRLKHGERLGKDGRVDLSNIDVYYRPADDQDPFQTDVITLNGGGSETFMPRFNYKGFRYVEVSSSQPVQLDTTSLVGYFMHSDVPAIGQIHSSNPLVDRIAWAANNSYLSNLFGYPTDCPQREKNGWTGDGHFAIETALYNFDGITIYEKWLADHRDEQQPNGVLPDIIPTGGWGYGTANGTDWTSTIAIIPWNLYLFYGDIKPLSDNYEAIKRYVNYVTQISPAGLTTWGRGDWVPVKSKSSLELTSSIYYYVDAVILSKAADLLEKPEDHEHYSRLAVFIKKAINDKYLNRETGVYASGTQTELSMPLMWDVVPESLAGKVAARLAARVEADGNHIDVGVLGAKALLNALSENGYADLAYKLAARDSYPSWGWWIVNGATTLLENWDINATRDISDNHMMFGEIGAWFFKGLGGIKPDEHRPGFKHVLIEPHFAEGLEHFEAAFEGPYGEIRSSWKRTGSDVALAITVPANSTATFNWDVEKRSGAVFAGNTYRTGTVLLPAGRHELVLKK
ncbi:alpha-L-rhamnosidase [Parapedobacter koreensis]|uniref:alpha-L-rhamnosidase n=1 Tax=Parapedobacter koreensis TaxID=332977 RepID=A0A1H7F258_9SPHI|nr:alpha-L-rhamnosidase [Parapedobacter koreensis]SEK20181.1 alpha-L-rhamnosidase [Parapedobacter koreensis]